MLVLIVSGVLLLLLLLVLLLLFFPLRVELALRLDNLALQREVKVVLLGFIPLTLPQPKKKQREYEQEEQVNPLEKLREVYALARFMVRYAKKIITIRRCSTDMVIGLSDPMAAGILYGSYYSVATGIFNLISGNFRVKQWHFNIAPDFVNDCIVIDHRSSISTVPAWALVCAVWLLLSEARMRHIIFQKPERNDSL